MHAQTVHTVIGLKLNILYCTDSRHSSQSFAKLESELEMSEDTIMEGNTQLQSTSSYGNGEFRVYPRRWFMLLVICLANVGNAMVCNFMLSLIIIWVYAVSFHRDRLLKIWGDKLTL